MLHIYVYIHVIVFFLCSSYCFTCFPIFVFFYLVCALSLLFPSCSPMFFRYICIASFSTHSYLHYIYYGTTCGIRIQKNTAQQKNEHGKTQQERKNWKIRKKKQRMRIYMYIHIYIHTYKYINTYLGICFFNIHIYININIKIDIYVCTYTF